MVLDNRQLVYLMNLLISGVDVYTFETSSISLYIHKRLLKYIYDLSLLNINLKKAILLKKNCTIIMHIEKYKLINYHSLIYF